MCQVVLSMEILYAAMLGHITIIHYLIEEQKCDAMCINYTDTTPLLLSAEFGHLSIVKYLLEQQCDLTHQHMHMQLLRSSYCH